MRRGCALFAVVLVSTLAFVPGAAAKMEVAKKPRPATAQLTFAGDAGLAGLATGAQINCNQPNPDGSVSMFLLDQPPDPAVLFNMHVSADKISVSVLSGSGTTFRGRAFEGTGVKHFNAARGVQIDSTLTEVTEPGANPGTLGVITSIKGTIKCGDQTRGTSTVTVSGKTADGAVSGAVRPFRVQCNTSQTNGDTVALVGVVKVGTEKAYFFTTFMPDGINIFETFPGPPSVQHQYVVKAPGVSKLSATGARANGKVVEQSPTSGEAHTLRVKGKVTCGATVNF